MAAPGMVLCDYDTWQFAEAGMESEPPAEAQDSDISAGENSGNKARGRNNNFHETRKAVVDEDSSNRKKRTSIKDILTAKKSGGTQDSAKGSRSNHPKIGARYKMALDMTSPSSIPSSYASENVIRIVGTDLGSHKLKGIESDVHLIQASSLDLEMRPIPVRFTKNAA